jgi:hypothetical protein
MQCMEAIACMQDKSAGHMCVYYIYAVHCTGSKLSLFVFSSTMIAKLRLFGSSDPQPNMYEQAPDFPDQNTPAPSVCSLV